MKRNYCPEFPGTDVRTPGSGMLEFQRNAGCFNYTDCHNFKKVIEKAAQACENAGVKIIRFNIRAGVNEKSFAIIRSKGDQSSIVWRKNSAGADLQSTFSERFSFWQDCKS